MKQKHAVDGRRKDFLTDAEMSRFLQAARSGRHGIRNYAMMLMRSGMACGFLNSSTFGSGTSTPRRHGSS
jgi:hypothetical protein